MECDTRTCQRMPEAGQIRPMRRAFLLAVSLLLVGCPHNPPAPVPPPLRDWTITVTFNYNFTNYPVCSVTVTTGCVNGFTWGYLQGAKVVPLKTSPTTICTGSTQPQTCTDSANAQLGIGPITPYCVANGVDNNGSAVSSVQDTGPVDNIVLIPPANLSETRQ